MKAVIYSSTPVEREEGVQAFNASAFPCHSSDIEVVYLNGNFPEIEQICKESGLECLPFSKYQKPKNGKSTQVTKDKG